MFPAQSSESIPSPNLSFLLSVDVNSKINLTSFHLHLVAYYPIGARTPNIMSFNRLSHKFSPILLPLIFHLLRKRHTCGRRFPKLYPYTFPNNYLQSALVIACLNSSIMSIMAQTNAVNLPSHNTHICQYTNSTTTSPSPSSPSPSRPC